MSDNKSQADSREHLYFISRGCLYFTLRVDRVKILEKLVNNPEVRRFQALYTFFPKLKTYRCQEK
jgi:hypothetical protein